MLGKLLRLTPADWKGLGLAYVYLLAAGSPVFARRDRLERWLANGLTTEGQRALPLEAEAVLARQCRWFTAVARRVMPRSRCLQRSVALCLWMERNGYRPELKIGVCKEGAGIKAHSWVEHGGRALNDYPAVLARFTTLTSDRASTALSYLREEGY